MLNPSISLNDPLRTSGREGGCMSRFMQPAPKMVSSRSAGRDLTERVNASPHYSGTGEPRGLAAVIARV